MLTLDDAKKLLESGIEPWKISDIILNSVYPNWPHIPNKGMLRGSIASLVFAMRELQEKK